jgi:hypothetical protein
VFTSCVILTCWVWDELNNLLIPIKYEKVDELFTPGLVYKSLCLASRLSVTFSIPILWWSVHVGKDHLSKNWKRSLANIQWEWMPSSNWDLTTALWAWKKIFFQLRICMRPQILNQ